MEVKTNALSEWMRCGDNRLTLVAPTCAKYWKAIAVLAANDGREPLMYASSAWEGNEGGGHSILEALDDLNDRLASEAGSVMGAN